jgi:hypothetical protein
MLMEIGGINLDALLEYFEKRPHLTEEQMAVYLKEKRNLLSGGETEDQTILTLDGKKGDFRAAGKKRDLSEIRKAREAGEFLMLPSVEPEWIEYIKEHLEIPFMPNTITSKKVYPPPPRFHFYGLVRGGRVRHDQTISGVHEMFVDQTDDYALSKAIMLMRKIDWYYIDFLRTKIPGFEDVHMIKTSPMVGTRESRRLIGEYVLTAKDCMEGRKFDDAIALCGRASNIHNMEGKGGIWYWLEPDDTYSIPYRCLLPKRIDNLLVAGRCSSVDFIALGATRSMPTCMTIGEAAGLAAALSAKQGISPKALDVTLLKSKLMEQGVLLPENMNK